MPEKRNMRGVKKKKGVMRGKREGRDEVSGVH
jgi:hypothetical protein